MGWRGKNEVSRVDKVGVVDTLSGFLCRKVETGFTL